MIFPFEVCINVTDKIMPNFPKEIFYFKNILAKTLEEITDVTEA